MKILIVMDPLEAVDAHKDTTFGFMLAAQARGHDVFYCTQDLLYLRRGGRGAVVARQVEVRLQTENFFTADDPIDCLLDDFHTVWMRKDPPVDRAYLHATYVLDHTTALVLNDPAGIRSANEKLYALHFAEFMPETLVTREPARIEAWLAERTEPLIVKPVDGHGGYGIFKLEKHDRNVASILEVLTESGERWVMVQAYLPAAREGDKRIILIDGKPQGAIMRVPQASDNRGNIHVGGSVHATQLTPREVEICAAIGPRLRKDGLTFVGLDVIGDHITEINVTSPTGIREIENLDGTPVGENFVAWVEARVKQC